LTSSATFGLHILLARWLSPSQYGAFVVGFSIYLFVSSFHNSLILEPMSVVGPSRKQDKLREYISAVVWMHAGLSLVLAFLMATAAWVTAGHSAAVAVSLAGVAISTPWMLLFWLVRRACYLDTRPSLAFEGSAFYAVLLLGGLAVAARFGAVSIISAFVLLALCSVIASVALAGRLGLRPSTVFSLALAPRVVEAVREHWAYARWCLGSTLVYTLASSIYLPLVSYLSGLETAAAWRAIDNLLLPMSQVLTALGVLLLPWAARSAMAGMVRLQRVAAWISLVASVVTAAYVLAVLLIGSPLIRLVYHSEFYARFTCMIPFLGAAVLLRAISDTGIGVAVRAAGRPDIVFWGTLAAATSTMTAGIWLVAQYGPLGAAAGWTISSAAHCAVILVLFRKWMK
jgi:O-antigen/teichoic acid export membrane protein